MGIGRTGRREAGGRPRRRVRGWHKAALVLAAVLLAPFAYRLAAVYRFDRSCPEPTGGKPAVVFRVGAGSAGAPGRLTLLDYNIEGHAALFHPDHLEQVAAVIRRSGADLVGLEEVNRGRWTVRFGDQARDLARLTGLELGFGASFREFGGEFGNAVLTRGRIIAARAYPLPSFGEPRSVLRCDVDLGGRTVTAFVAHLTSWGGLARAERRRQVECLTGIIRSTPHPFVVLGDLNAVPEAAELAPLLGLKTLLFCGERSDETYPSLKCRLDYILADARWKLLGSRVLREGPSDHWPILATLELP
ncbi:MAG: endonuclease/exonuclease/phosphatase family protein [Deltaproteobacteria bacterium]|nr:endonuclease/exonuclease/phosphatase family protein [Deltaproteobacteria bacterium]